METKTSVDVSGGESKVQSCKEQHCIGTWHVRATNQGKVDVIKLEVTRVHISILAVSEPKWVRMSEI